ncbi:MAG TPA: O-antigen ligase family protein [Pyrinomonadaceae bacterium]|nr:O-antigen ligase family protein [Pyrinomonadaceae bacterium]
MSQAATLRVQAVDAGVRPAHESRAAILIGKVIFGSLLGLLALTAIPYGTSHPWWIAAFICAVFVLTILWLVDGYIKQTWFAGFGWVALPIVLLATFSLLQTIQLPQAGPNPGGISYSTWNAISTDPYQTRFFAMELTALALAGILAFRYASSERRLRLIINVVIGVAVCSALFGILRQTTQRSAGFGFILLPADLGYGQFINKNHFAFLMEMAFGLGLGMLLLGGVRRDRQLIYFALLLPLWTAIVLSGSRGGLIALLAQLMVAALIYSFVARKGSDNRVPSKFLQLTRTWPVRIILTLLLAAGIAIGTVWVGGDRLARTFEASENQLVEDNSELRIGVSRSEIWKATRNMFLAHPFLGVGMGAYWTAVPAFHDASGTMTPQEAHNDYLELLASGGLVGFGLGVWFLVVVVKRTRENLKSPNRFRRASCFGASIGLAGVAVHSLLDFGLHTMANALVFTTLIVIATSKAQWAEAPTVRTYE